MEGYDQDVIRTVALPDADHGIYGLGVLVWSNGNGARGAAAAQTLDLDMFGNSLDYFCLGGRHADYQGPTNLTFGDIESVSCFFLSVSNR